MEKKDEEMTGALRQDMNYLNDRLKVDKSFDLIYRTIEIGGREACMYFIDGFCKDELMEKILQYFLSIKAEAMPEDALTMNQESLAECLYEKKWYNPFPKFKYTERLDTAAAQVLEGNIIILVDNFKLLARRLFRLRLPDARK